MVRNEISMATLVAVFAEQITLNFLILIRTCAVDISSPLQSESHELIAYSVW
jgi:hypothetical protein